MNLSTEPSRLKERLHWLDRRQPLVVNIAEQLAIEIIYGNLKPGHELNSVGLSQRFQTSRTPIREALMILEQEGLVEFRARHHPRVRMPSFEEIQQAFEVRSQLISLAITKAIERATDDVLSKLDDRLCEIKEACDAKDADAFFWSHCRWLDCLIEAAGNSALRQALDLFEYRTVVCRHRASLLDPEHLEVSLILYKQATAACRERDRETADAAMKRLAEASLRRVEEGWAAADSRPLDAVDPATQMEFENRPRRPPS